MIVPRSQPQMSEAKVLDILAKHGVVHRTALLGIRGYYSHTFAPPGNNRAVYDDAIFLVGPGIFVSFNANTDPSAYRKGIASLKTGSWLYKIGTHGLSKPVAQRYPALVQAAEVTVSRDGQGDDTGWFGINIHRGGYSGTSSLGCQTIHPKQWPAFISLVKQAMASAEQKVIPYLLLDLETI